MWRHGRLQADSGRDHWTHTSAKAGGRLARKGPERKPHRPRPPSAPGFLPSARQPHSTTCSSPTSPIKEMTGNRLLSWTDKLRTTNECIFLSTFSSYAGTGGLNKLSISCPFYRSVLMLKRNTHRFHSLRRSTENPKIQSEKEAKGIFFRALDWFHMRWLDSFVLIALERTN